jgi:hypothetical protein
MRGSFILFLFLVIPFVLRAQEEAVTASGKVVLLFPDSTWKVKKIAGEDPIVNDSTQTDSLAMVKPEKKVKQYNDTIIGFKGFLKTQEINIPALPEFSDGIYEYRVKVNKEGWVKEVITTKRGPNGGTDQVIRNAIYKFKLRPDGSIVAPLTEGVIRITVPAKKD